MTAMTGEFRDYHEQVGMGEALRRAFSNYATFKGRANRGEYWWFILASIIIGALLSMVDGVVGTAGLLAGLWNLAAFLPSLAVAVRRLHDVGRSGWWILIAFVPVIGFILLIVWLAARGEARPNRFG